MRWVANHSRKSSRSVTLMSRWIVDDNLPLLLALCLAWLSPCLCWDRRTLSFLYLHVKWAGGGMCWGALTAISKHWVSHRLCLVPSFAVAANITIFAWIYPPKTGVFPATNSSLGTGLSIRASSLKMAYHGPSYGLSRECAMKVKIPEFFLKKPT